MTYTPEMRSRVQIAANLGGKGLTPSGRRKIMHGLAIHIGKCTICRSPDRKRIERDFINYVPKAQITKKWGLPNKESLNCHLNFFPGLIQRRNNNRKGVFQAIIDRGMEVLPDENITAGHILEANSQIARMEGLFQDSLHVSAEKIAEKASMFTGMSPDQIQMHRAKILEQLAFPERQVFAPVFQEENKWGENEEPGELTPEGTGAFSEEEDGVPWEDEEDSEEMVKPEVEPSPAIAEEESQESVDEEFIPGTHAGPRPGRKKRHES